MQDPASLLASLQARLQQQSRQRHGLAAALTRCAAITVAVIRDLAFGEILLRATSLVYTTLLSIVPMLALTFSLSKAFGVHGQIEPALQRFLEPLGPRGLEISDQIIGFINNMHVGVLGSVGLAMLFFTAISTILKIESAINSIWHVRDLRPISYRITGYLTILLLGPIVVFSTLGINAAAASSRLVQTLIAIEPFGELFILAGKLLPYVLIIALFLLLYLYMPNTRVRFWPALISALVAGIAWQTAGWGFARFVANSSQYEAIYSGFAIIILFMIWLYVSWIVVLTGASIGFYIQHPEYRTLPPGQEARISSEGREQLALAIMQEIGDRFRLGSEPPRTDELVQQFQVPSLAISDILDALNREGLVLRADGKTSPSGWVPARDLDSITLWQVLDAVRRAGTLSPMLPARKLRSIEAFTMVQDRFNEVLSETSFRELLQQGDGRPAELPREVPDQLPAASPDPEAATEATPSAPPATEAANAATGAATDVFGDEAPAPAAGNAPGTASAAPSAASAQTDAEDAAAHLRPRRSRLFGNGHDEPDAYLRTGETPPWARPRNTGTSRPTADTPPDAARRPGRGSHSTTPPRDDEVEDVAWHTITVREVDDAPPADSASNPAPAPSPAGGRPSLWRKDP